MEKNLKLKNSDTLEDSINMDCLPEENFQIPKSLSLNAYAVEGEASESDDDDDDVETQDTISVQQNLNATNVRDNYVGSSLQWQLVGINSIFWHTLNKIILNNFSRLSHKLMNVDLMLLNSHIKLQSVSYTLQSSNTDTKTTLNKIKDIMSDNFVPELKSKLKFERTNLISFFNGRRIFSLVFVGVT